MVDRLDAPLTVHVRAAPDSKLIRPVNFTLSLISTVLTALGTLYCLMVLFPLNVAVEPETSGFGTAANTDDAAMQANDMAIVFTFLPFYINASNLFNSLSEDYLQLF